MYKIILKGKTYKRRLKLRMMGYSWNEDKHYWEREFKNYPSRHYTRKVSYIPGVRFEIVDMDQCRSTDYRRRYLSENHGVKTRNGKIYYRCVYCGKLLRDYNMQVDHIYPVKRAETDPKIRKALNKRGISNVNDTRNLVSSCSRCNSRKGTQLGWWITKANLGRHEIYWKIRRLIELIIVAVAIIGLLYLDGHKDLLEYIRIYLSNFIRF